MARKKTRGAVLQPSGRVQPGYDSFPLKMRPSNIVPLPTKQVPLTKYIQEKAREADNRPRLHANPRIKKSRGNMHSSPPKTHSSPSPTCTKLEFQPAETSVKFLEYIPVVIDFKTTDAVKVAEQLASTAGIPIRTLGALAEHDITLRDNVSGLCSVAKLVELAFCLSGAPYVAIVRQNQTEKGWLTSAIQNSMDNRAPMALISFGGSGSFSECSLILERSNFLIDNKKLNKKLWNLSQQIILV